MSENGALKLGPGNIYLMCEIKQLRLEIVFEHEAINQE